GGVIAWCAHGDGYAAGRAAAGGTVFEVDAERLFYRQIIVQLCRSCSGIPQYPDARYCLHRLKLGGTLQVRVATLERDLPFYSNATIFPTGSKGSSGCSRSGIPKPNRCPFSERCDSRRCPDDVDYFPFGE